MNTYFSYRHSVRVIDVKMHLFKKNVSVPPADNEPLKPAPLGCDRNQSNRSSDSP